MALSAKDQRFEDEMQEILGHRGRKRMDSVPDLPENLSMLDLPEVEDYFKMISIMETGSIHGWTKIRENFILQQKEVPSGQNLTNQNAALLAHIKNSPELGMEDQVMNDFGVNDVIESIDRGTTDIDDGRDKLQKMGIIEGNMPGQGKSKEGNWRG